MISSISSVQFLVPDDLSMPYPRICAHRGFNTVAPENSLPAFGAAIAMGADEIEFDVRFTADGVPVSIHDPSLDRVSNGTGLVEEKTFAELEQLDFGVKCAPQFAGLFSRESDVSYYCVLFLRQNIFFFVSSCVTQVYSGTLRGAGNSKTPMILMLTSYVAFRQIYLFIVKQVCYTPSLVGFGYPAGWMLCALLTALYYRFSGWEKKLN